MLQEITLGKLFRIGSSKRVLQSQWKPEGVPFYRGREITKLAMDGVVDNELFIDEELYNEFATRYGVPDSGDIMITAIGTIGNSYVVQDGDRFYFKDASVLWLKKASAIDSQFINYWLKSPQFFDQLDRGNGATVDTLTIQKLQSVRVDLPSLPEQHRIVAILDAAFDGIATAKANAEQNLQNARALFESHLQRVFTERGEKYKETALGAVCEFVGGSQPPKAVFEKEPTDHNIRLIQIRDYKTDKHIVYIPRSMAKRFCDANDVMIGRYGPPLFQILRGLDGAYNVALMKAVPDESKLSRDYLFYFLKHSDILQYVIYHSERAAGQIGVTKETLEPYPIALPALETQKQIVSSIMELESETQRLESLYQQKLTALDDLKKSLLHQAFSGNL